MFRMRSSLIGLLLVAAIGLAAYSMPQTKVVAGKRVHPNSGSFLAGTNFRNPGQAGLDIVNSIDLTLFDPALSEEDPAERSVGRLDGASSDGTPVERLAGHSDAPCAEQQAAIEQLTARLPRRQLSPSPDSPFVFLHNRKCGGSTMRQALVSAAELHNLTAIIPCFPPINDCYRYNLRNIAPEVLNRVSIAGGHLSWDAMEDLGAQKNTSCYFMMRDPVDMFASYFYHRHPLAFRDKKQLAEIPAEELRLSLDPDRFQDKDTPWEWWELGGPANSATRMLSGADITGHLIGYDAADYVQLRKGIPLNVTLAKERMDRCVVGLLSDMAATYQAIEYWFSWLPRTDFVLNVNDKRPRKEGLPDDVRKVILDYMSLDVELHEYGLKRFHMQTELLAAVAKLDGSVDCT